MNKVVTRLIIAVVVIVGIIYCTLNFKNDAELALNDPLDASSSVDSASANYPKNNKEQKLYENNPVNQSASLEISNRVAFEAQWCSRYYDLRADDLDYSFRESNDWELARGNIILAKNIDRTTSYVTDSDIVAQSYMQMSDEKLYELEEFGDDMALLVLLSRDTVDFNERIRIAKKLIVKGKTGNALAHLIIAEMVKMTASITDSSELLAEHKANLIRAIVYVNYGLDCYDASGRPHFCKYLMVLEKTLMELLTIEDNQTIEHSLTRLKENIDKKRADLNLEPLSNLDIPKIARHDFEHELAYNYIDFSEHLNALIHLMLLTAVCYNPTNVSGN